MRNTEITSNPFRTILLLGVVGMCLASGAARGDKTMALYGLGGSQDDRVIAVATDVQGNIYLAGETYSVDFPVVRAAQPYHAGGYSDAFVVKLDPSGTRIVYSTYLGGGAEDAAFGVAVDKAGNAFVTGVTNSPSFTTTAGAYDRLCGTDGMCNEARRDAFLIKLDPAGAMVFSTFFGGSDGEYSWSVAVDSRGRPAITGSTASRDLPLKAPIQTWHRGGTFDGWVALFSADGSTLLSSTYFGGSGDDYPAAIALDSMGNVVLGGYTQSTDFPQKTSLQPGYAGGANDGFVAMFENGANKLKFASYLGGAGDDRVQGVAVDGRGNLYVAGTTSSTNFPVRAAAQPSNRGRSDMFVAGIAGKGGLLFSTYLGGSGNEVGTALVLAGRQLLVVGATDSTNFPVSANAQQAHFGGGRRDAALAVVRLDTGQMAYSSYLGGTNSESGAGAAAAASGDWVVAGSVAVESFGEIFTKDLPQSGDAFYTRLPNVGP